MLAIAWCLRNPNVSTVILGASKVAQLEENLQASAAAEKLTPELMTQIDEIMGTRAEGSSPTAETKDPEAG